MNSTHDNREPLATWLAREPFALGLSSGFFGFFAHTGLLRALEVHGLRPTKVAGASAGALAGCLWAAGLEALTIRRELERVKRRDFWDPWPGLGLLRGKKFRALLASYLPVQRFEECPIPLAVSAYDALGRRTRVFDRGELVPAIHASCAVPFLFQPVWIEGRPLWDGGIRDRPGIEGLQRPSRVLYHHIPSRSARRETRPRRPDLFTLSIRDLPRVGPRRLDQGPRAFEQAYRAASVTLAAPVSHTSRATVDSQKAMESQKDGCA